MFLLQHSQLLFSLESRRHCSLSQLLLLTPDSLLLVLNLVIICLNLRPCTILYRKLDVPLLDGANQFFSVS